MAELSSFTLEELQLTPEQRAVVGLRERIVEGLNSAHKPNLPEFAEALDATSRHDGHRYHGGCYVCRGDVEEMARFVQTQVAPMLVQQEQEIARLRAELEQLRG